MRVGGMGRLVGAAALAFVIALAAPCAALADAAGGTLTSAVTGLPLSGIEADAYYYDSGEASWLVWDWGYSAADGTWSITGLPDNTYAFGFFDPALVYREEFYNDQPSVTAAQTFAIAAGAPVSGIDASLSPVPSITGQVRLSNSGAPAAGIEVGAWVFDGVAWSLDTTTTTDPDGFYALVGLGDGTYRVGGSDGSGPYTDMFWPAASTVDSATDVITTAFATVTGVDFSLTGGPADIRRLAFDDRYQTAVAVWQEVYPGWAGVGDVVIASGDDHAAADPLAASGLSWAYHGAPVLLMSPTTAPVPTDRTIADIVDVNGTATLHIVGGTHTIPDSRIAQMRRFVADALGITLAEATSRTPVDRVQASGDRYAMAGAIARRMKAQRPGEFTAEALYANGAETSRFFDALALAPVAASTGRPVLLVTATSVPAATTSAIATLGIDPAGSWVAGGTSTIRPQVLAALGVPESHRMAGADRYATAAAVADNAVSRGWLDAAAVGVGSKLPDATSGGAMLGTKRAPLLLTAPDALPAASSQWFAANKATVGIVYVLGGDRSVTPAVVSQIAAALQ